MREDLERGMPGIDGPRALRPEFRAQLEESIRAATTGDSSVVASTPAERWELDGPRELSPQFRARLEAKIIRRTRPGRTLQMRLSAAIAAMLVLASVLVAANHLNRPAGKIVAGPLVVQPPPAPTPQAPAPLPPGSLRAFASEAEFLSYVRGEGLKLTGPYGIQSYSPYGTPALGGPMRGISAPSSAGGEPGAPAQPMVALAPSTTYSSTNVQEEGVDEPDLVKTDGRRLVVVSYSRLTVLDVSSGTPKLSGSLSIPNGSGAFLIGDRVIHFASLYQAPPEAAKITHVIDRPWTKITVVDIAKPSSPQVLNSFEVEGSFVDARLVGGVVRLVVTSGSLGPQPVYAADSSSAVLKKAEATNKRAIRGSSVGDWVPHFVVQRKGAPAVTGHVHDWSAVSRPPDKAGVGMLTLLTIDPANPRPDNAQSVVGAGQIVYASPDALYVTSNAANDLIGLQRRVAPRAPVTRIHKFDIRDPSTARYVGSGEVPGFVLNQFSLSESEGFLRIATTIQADWFSEGASSSSSRVSILAEREGKLVIVGSVGNLGKGERIYSVRFLGNKGYVVTFRQIDPLYVVDLANPSKPVVRGQLKIPGYSDYLHPVSETQVLGIGRAADGRGVPGGLQVSLFDVSNPAAPKRLEVGTYGVSGSSSVGNEHHGFLYWEPKHLAVIPAQIVDDPNGQTVFVGALALTLTSSGFGEPTRITQSAHSSGDPYDASILRSLVIGSRLYTVSQIGILASDLTSFADRGWVALAQ